MLTSRPFLRRLAAALALIGLATAPVRALGDCPMLPGASDAAVSAASDDAAVAAHHHGAARAPAASADLPAPAVPAAPAEAPAPVPSHDDAPCPDLAHCAVIGTLSEAPVLDTRVLPVAPAAFAAPVRPSSASRAIETPPPKRGTARA